MAQSFIESTMFNGDGTKYGIAYFFFPKTDGYPVGNPNDFRGSNNDIWNQTMVEEFDSLEAALEHEAKYQQDV